MWSWSPLHKTRMCHHCCYGDKYAKDRRDYELIRRNHGIPVDRPMFAMPIDKALAFQRLIKGDVQTQKTPAKLVTHIIPKHPSPSG